MQTAVNPKTGETAVLVDGKWAVAEKIATNSESGDKAYLINGKWLTQGGEANLPPTGEKKTLGGDIARQIGLTVRHGVEAATALPAMLANPVAALYNSVSGDGGFKFPDQQAAVSQLLTKLGLPSPENSTERVVGDVSQALGGTGALAKFAQRGPSVLSGLADNLGTQAASAAAASGAAGTTREMGGGPGSQLLAGLAAGIGVPTAAQIALNVPRNAVAQSVLKSERKPFATEGERLANETGIELTLGQRTGNKLVLNAENAARQYGPTADRVQEIDVKIANQAIDRVTKIADRISKTNSDPATLGTKIEETVKNAARRLDMVRDKLAGRDYGKVRELAGDQPVIKFQNFADELKKIVSEYQNVPGADAQKITSQAKAALDRVTGTLQQASTGGAIVSEAGAQLTPGQQAVKGVMDNTINEALRARRFYGQAAKGAANVFDDVAPNINRTLASRLFGAINKDFDESASNAGGALRSALDKANGNYKKVSQSLEFLEKSALGKLVGEDIADAAISGAKVSTTAGESVVQKIMSTHPSSRKTAMDILDRWNPDLAKETRAFVLRDALDKGMSIPPSAKGAGQVPISFNKFVSALQGDKVGFEKQLQSYGFKPAEIKDIKDTVAAMVRAGDRTGYNYSGTNVQSETMEMASAVGQGVMGNVKGAITKTIAIGGKIIGLKRFASAMESAKGREAIRTLASAKPSPQAAIAAFETIESGE